MATRPSSSGGEREGERGVALISTGTRNIMAQPWVRAGNKDAAVIRKRLMEALMATERPCVSYDSEATGY